MVLQALLNISGKTGIILVRMINALNDVNESQRPVLLRSSSFGGQPWLKLAAGLPAVASAKAGGA